MFVSEVILDSLIKQEALCSLPRITGTLSKARRKLYQPVFYVISNPMGFLDISKDLKSEKIAQTPIFRGPLRRHLYDEAFLLMARKNRIERSR